MIEPSGCRHDGLEIGAGVNHLTIDLKPQADDQDVVLRQASDELSAAQLAFIDFPQRLQDLPRLVMIIHGFGV
jgi:hypothetical protein